MYNLINSIYTKYYIIHDAATIFTYKYHNDASIRFHKRQLSLQTTVV